MTGGATTPFRVHVNPGGAGPSDLLRRAVVQTLRREGVAEAEVSVTLLDDADMAALNRRWLDRAGSTDVLAFSLTGAGEEPLGDVYIGRDRAARQAAEYGVPVEEELVRLVVHGTLHVLGYDHPEGPERAGSEMFRRQEALVRELLPSGSRARPAPPPAAARTPGGEGGDPAGPNEVDGR